MEITKKSCKARLINFCFLNIWNKLQKCAEQNSREFPLGGPSPCGKTGLAPTIGNVFFLPFWLFLSFFPFKPKNPRYKIRPPKSTPKINETVPRKHYCFFGFIIVVCVVHWISHHVPKRKKKSREFPLAGRPPVVKRQTGLAPCRQSTFFSLFVCSSFVSHLFWNKSPNSNPKTPKHPVVRVFRRQAHLSASQASLPAPFGRAAALTTNSKNKKSELIIRKLAIIVETGGRIQKYIKNLDHTFSV